MELTSRARETGRDRGEGQAPAIVALPARAAGTPGERPADAAVDVAALAPGDAWLTLLALLPQTSVGRLLYYMGLKRGLDLVVASLALLILGLPMLLVALVIRLDSPGPGIFRQERIGRGGRPFKLFKFRTMVDDGQGDTLRLLPDDDGQLRHKVKHDPRVTRVGKYLRRTSFDEVPQLLNVLRGEMSLVGPRPELPPIVRGYEPWQHRRHLVRPGLTGWWQISGRSDQPMHEHTELDLYYIEHLSFRLDLRILWKTVRVVLSGLGAF